MLPHQALIFPQKQRAQSIPNQLLFFSNIPFDHADNLIEIFGTNVYGHFTNDFVTIHRETWEETKPFINITNTPVIIPYIKTTAEISGTNVNIYGQLAWVNDRTPDTTNLFTTGFSTIVNNLAFIDSDKCKLCRKCVSVCPTNAIIELNFPPRKIKVEDKNECSTTAK